jgi:glycosyltransferase involved in cell wall biosynthesis
MKYFFSIIIPSFNRLEEIQELLFSLQQQTLPKDRFQVIIVDDGSTDGTHEWLKDYQNKSQLHFQFFRQDHKGPGAARNTGIAKASGDVLVFIDSDCIAPPDWLREIRNVFENDPGIQAFGGRDDARQDFPPLLKAINYTMTSFLFTGGMRGGKRRRLAKFYPRSFNMGIRKKLALKIGGFSELRHGQDIEYSHRIIKSQTKVAYIPKAVVFHKRRTSIFKFFRQVFNWGVARINLYKIDHELLEPLHFMPAIVLWTATVLTVVALVVQPFFIIWSFMAVAALVAVLASSIHAAIRWRSLATGLLVIPVTFIQIAGYGLGFTIAFLWRVIMHREKFTGFTKKYY